MRPLRCVFPTLVAIMAATAVSGCAGTPAPKAVVSVSPATALWDRARSIVVSRLRPAQRVTLRAQTSLPDGLWASSATFRANSHGVVDVSRQAPLSGSYGGVSAMGLLWSEKPIRRRRGPLNGEATSTISARVGGRLVASAKMTQRLNGPGVRMHDERVSSGGFYGVYYSPAPSASHAPAVVLWGGSEGDLATASEAGLLASHGIPALALAYFDDPGLPCRLENIPLEYFVKAISWLRHQPQVDPQRVWIMSASRGTEAELLVATHFRGVVHGLVAIAPSEYVNGAYHGKCQTTASQGRTPAWTLRGKPIPPGTVVAVRRITANVLLIAGGDDTVWPSYVQAPRIMAGLPHNRAAHRYLYYPQAGHIVVNIPFSPVSNAVLGDGGTVASESHAWISDWPAMISFISTH